MLPRRARTQGLAWACWACLFGLSIGVRAANTPPQAQVWLRDMERLDAQLVRTQKALIDENRRCRANRDRLRDTQSKARRLGHEVDARRRTYARRLAALVKLGPRPRWSLAQGGSGLSQILYLKRMTAHLAKYDEKAHEALLLSQDALLEAERTRAIDVQVQADSVAARRRMRDNLAERRALKSELAETILTDPKTRAAWARDNDDAHRRLMSLIASEQDPAPLTHDSFIPGLLAERGQLRWPAEGPVTLGFGQQAEAHFGTVVHHHGLDIAAPPGSPARAVAAGRVVYADWLRGYGQVVIVDHADGYHAVLAHLANIHVKAGEWVARGEELGSVGDTGSLRGPLLYLELRHHGAPIDPSLWLERRS